MAQIDDLTKIVDKIAAYIIKIANKVINKLKNSSNK
jgi:hypothetical protein